MPDLAVVGDVEEVVEVERINLDALEELRAMDPVERAQVMEYLRTID